MICNNSTLSLPENIENLTCELCNAGYYHHEKTDGSECEPCEDGTSMTETKVENECLECQPGLYAPKVLNYTH